MIPRFSHEKDYLVSKAKPTTTVRKTQNKTLENIQLVKINYQERIYPIPELSNKANLILFSNSFLHL